MIAPAPKGSLLERTRWTAGPFLRTPWQARFQFVEKSSSGQSRQRVRIDPAVGEVDERQILAAISDELGRTDSGGLAEALWSSSGSLEVDRAQPLLTPAERSYR